MRCRWVRVPSGDANPGSTVPIMVNVAKDPSLIDRDLPAASGHPAPAEAHEAAGVGVPGPGLSLAAVLELDCLRGARILAGHAGLDRVVSRLNVMEVPDILPWVKPQELLLTTGYPLRGVPHSLPVLVSELAQRGLAGMAVKLGRYLEELPPAMLQEADRLGLPVIALPENVGFDDVINQVLTEVLNRQAALLARAEEAHRALVHVVLSGGGLVPLCEELVGIYGGAAMVTTADGRVLASAGRDGELEQALALDCFDRSGRFVVESEPVGVRPPGDERAQRAVVRIVAGPLDHGRLVAFSNSRELTAEDIHILERAATVAALAITKSQAVSAVESKYQADFLRDALAGRAGNAERVTAHAHSLGWDIGRRMVVVVAETDPNATPKGLGRDELRSLQDRFATAWSQTVRVRDEHAPVVGFSQEVVTVLGVPEDADSEGITRMVRDMVRVVSGDGGGGRRSFSTGISRPVDSADQLPQAYEQACKAVSVGRQMHGPSALTHFDGLGIFRVLSLVPDTAELRSFVAEALGELVTNDSPENADLRTTLSVLLDTNLNVAETARILHFHYNTLRYRIVKLERMLGPFTTDPNLRLTLSLALQVVQMRGI
jgi:PucR family transcriptional regulator, purine catabolism regulatory protein